MTRDIKFRGWFQGINGQEYWVYGYLLKQTNGNWEITNGVTSWTVDNVGQFTGMFDKNGKEVYENDSVIWHKKNDIKIKAVVKYEQRACAFLLKWFDEEKKSRYIELNATSGGDYYQNDYIEVIEY